MHRTVMDQMPDHVYRPGRSSREIKINDSSHKIKIFILKLDN
jgi:hypothetical protein